MKQCCQKHSSGEFKVFDHQDNSHLCKTSSESWNKHHAQKDYIATKLTALDALELL